MTGWFDLVEGVSLSLENYRAAKRKQGFKSDLWFWFIFLEQCYFKSLDTGFVKLYITKIVSRAHNKPSFWVYNLSIKLLNFQSHWWHKWLPWQLENPKFKVPHCILVVKSVKNIATQAFYLISLWHYFNHNLVSTFWVDYLSQIKELQQTMLNRRIFKGYIFCCLNYSSPLIAVSILKYSLLFHARLSPYYSFSSLHHAVTHLTSKNWIIPCSLCFSVVPVFMTIYAVFKREFAMCMQELSYS